MTASDKVMITDMKLEHPMIVPEKEIIRPPGFNPPEFVINNEYTQKGDVWAVGCLFYLLLA